MTSSLKILLNEATEADIVAHLQACDIDFVPPLSGRTEINNFAKKILCNSTRFEAWSSGVLVGLVASYCNNRENLIAYITSVSVLREWNRQNIAACLLKQCIAYVKALGMLQIVLEVGRDNKPAIKLYEKSGFVASITDKPFVTMILFLEGREKT
jgi:ribosomal protein S18 acetylase RimI-like enzyme